MLLALWFSQDLCRLLRLSSRDSLAERSHVRLRQLALEALKIGVALNRIVVALARRLLILIII